MKDWKSDLSAIKKALTVGLQAVGAAPSPKLSKEVSQAQRFMNTASASAITTQSGAVDVSNRPPVRPSLARGAGNVAGAGGSQPQPASPVRSAQPAVAICRDTAQHRTAPVTTSQRTEQARRNSDAENLGRCDPAPAAIKAGSIAPTPQPMQPLPVPSSIKALRCVSVQRQSYFKEPDAWVSAGVQTQPPGSSAQARSIDVVVGLDFGTSYTKAAVGMLDKIYPVSWEGVTNSADKHLLPSEYTMLPDGRAQLGQLPGASDSDVRLDLKIPFIDPAVSMKSVATASVFLAQVLRYVRAWVYQFHRTKIGNTKIRWQLNLGAPSNGLENPRLTMAYRRLGCASWQLSERGLDENMSDAGDVATAWIDNVRPSSLQALDVFPEFVAQMAGYVQSPHRRRGLHALADVGGGTLDVVTFIVHQVEHEDTFPFLIPEVKSLGTHMLNQNRIVGVLLDTKVDMPDELMPVLDAKAFAMATSLQLSHVQQRDVIFQAQVSDVVSAVFSKTKARRYRLSETWTTGLPMFLTGGGATAVGYNEAISRGGNKSARRIDLMPLPLHPKIAEFNGDVRDYQRVSVACGLAQDAFSLGRIIPAKDVSDDRAPIAESRSRPDRDDLYAR